MPIEDLVSELERSYADAQERMGDPSVFSDHRTAADAGRRLKELEGPYKLAQEWREACDDLEAARSVASSARDFVALSHKLGARRRIAQVALSHVQRAAPTGKWL